MPVYVLSEVIHDLCSCEIEMLISRQQKYDV